MPGFKFGTRYVPPYDSPYYSPQSFSDIQEQLVTEGNIVILGDLKAHMPNFNDVLKDQTLSVACSQNRYKIKY